MKKRSVSIRGHKTSFSLEEEFWLELKACCARNNVSLAQLVTQIDTARAEDVNLSSALRLHVLRELQGQISDFIDDET